MIIDQIPSGLLSKQLIQDLNDSIALNKGSVLALRKIWLLKLNSSKHIKVYTFLFKINYLLHQLTSMELSSICIKSTQFQGKIRPYFGADLYFPETYKRTIFIPMLRGFFFKKGACMYVLLCLPLFEQILNQI